MNQFSFRHSARNLPLNASISPLSVGFPRRLKSSRTPFTYAHRSSTRPVNSLPLSTRIFAGRPRSRPTRSRIAATRSPVSRWSSSMTGLSRLKSSTNVNNRNFRPSKSWSAMKSMLQLSFTRTAVVRAGLVTALRCRRGLCRPTQSPSCRYSRYTRLRFTRQPSRRSFTQIRG